MDAPYIHSFTNKDEGMTAFVRVADKGFRVSLRDNDSDNYLPIFAAYPQEAAAIVAAKEMVGLLPVTVDV